MGAALKENEHALYLMHLALGDGRAVGAAWQVLFVDAKDRAALDNLCWADFEG